MANMYAIPMILLMVGITSSCLAAPMRLLVTELHVEENAVIIMKTMLAMFLTMLVMASGCSPRCSTKMMKANHVENDMKFCIIVQKDTFNMLRCP